MNDVQRKKKKEATKKLSKKKIKNAQSIEHWLGKSFAGRIMDVRRGIVMVVAAIPWQVCLKNVTNRNTMNLGCFPNNGRIIALAKNQAEWKLRSNR